MGREGGGRDWSFCSCWDCLGAAWAPAGGAVGREPTLPPPPHVPALPPTHLLPVPFWDALCRLLLCGMSQGLRWPAGCRQHSLLANSPVRFHRDCAGLLGGLWFSSTEELRFLHSAISPLPWLRVRLAFSGTRTRGKEACPLQSIQHSLNG